MMSRMLRRRRPSQESGGEGQGLPHQLHGLFVGPGAAVGFNQRVFGGNPVWLRVHDGSVHVPEDGFER